MADGAQGSERIMWSGIGGLREGGSRKAVPTGEDPELTTINHLAASHRRAATHRVKYLDGLRAVAVISVIGWHYYGPTYAGYLPYGSSFSSIPIFGKGWFGVYLFFLISGFVIFRTLETCSTMSEFLKRRWIRLAPALLICSVVIALASSFLPQMPPGGYNLRDILLGLTFVSPSFYHAIFKINVAEVDGAYWTLFTEFSFYIVFGTLYFMAGWRAAISGLIVLWIVAAGLQHVTLPILRRAPEPLWWAGCDHFGWFASGALFYRAHETRSNRLFALATGIAIASTLTNKLVVGYDMLVLLAMIVLFTTSQKFIFLQTLLSGRGLFFVGMVSYPLYLFHNHLGIGLISYVDRRIALPAAYIPVVVFSLMLGAAYVVHTVYEARVSRWLKKRLL